MMPTPSILAPDPLTAQLLISRISRVENIDVPIDLLILDEAHLLCTQNNLNRLLALEPKYVIVLTATPERDDGMEKILTALAGGKKHQFWLFPRNHSRSSPSKWLQSLRS